MNGILAPLIHGMNGILGFFFGLTGSYGWAIILLTLAIRAVLLPVSLYQMHNLRRMQAIAPLQKQIRDKYKKDPAKMNEELMALFQTHRINPMAGCLPTVIQLPFLWALFLSLQQLHPVHGGSIFWIPSLAQADPLHILPIFAGATTVLQGLLSVPGNNKDQSQRSVWLVMGVVFAWFTWKFPSGLALYWALSNVVSIGQQYFINRRFVPLVAEAKK